jgi:glutamyl-tRNA synthetase
MKTKPVVRFAPSPTGYLHIGGARTAIFNWLFARKHQGKFILRIEDTDSERSTDDAIKGIIEGLKWLGLDWDEGPYFQSRFEADHLRAAQTLLSSGHAYKCFCTREALEERRETARSQKSELQYDGACRNLTPEEIAAKEAAGIPHTLRFKVPAGDGSVWFEDTVYGVIEKKHRDIEDFIIVRSTGKPLYVLCNAVDDIRDGITHIIRGQDGLANTPKQILLYEALGAKVPEFAHMSLTLDPQKAKISKRKHGEMVAVHFYRDKGFLPWGLLNFLVLLGWATPDSRELFSREELIDAFSLRGISRNNSIFNIRQDDPRFFTDPKALSINAHYLRTLPVTELFPHIKTQLEKAGLWDNAYENGKREWFLSTVALLRQRFQVTSDFTTLGRPFFSDDFEMDPKVVQNNLLQYDAFKKWLPLIAERIRSLTPFTPETIEAALRAMIAEMGVKPNQMINAIRAAISGQAVGPGIIEVILALGRETVRRRLKKAQGLFPAG